MAYDPNNPTDYQKMLLAQGKDPAVYDMSAYTARNMFPDNPNNAEIIGGKWVSNLGDGMQVTGSRGLARYSDVVNNGMDPALLEGMQADRYDGQFSNQYGTATRQRGPNLDDPLGTNATFQGVDQQGNPLDWEGSYWGTLRQHEVTGDTYLPGWNTSSLMLGHPDQQGADRDNLYAGAGAFRDNMFYSGQEAGTNVRDQLRPYTNAYQNRPTGPVGGGGKGGGYPPPGGGGGGGGGGTGGGGGGGTGGGGGGGTGGGGTGGGGNTGKGGGIPPELLPFLEGKGGGGNPYPGLPPVPPGTVPPGDTSDPGGKGGQNWFPMPMPPPNAPPSLPYGGPTYEQYGLNRAYGVGGPPTWYTHPANQGSATQGYATGGVATTGFTSDPYSGYTSMELDPYENIGPHPEAPGFDDPVTGGENNSDLWGVSVTTTPGSDVADGDPYSGYETQELGGYGDTWGPHPEAPLPAPDPYTNISTTSPGDYRTGTGGKTIAPQAPLPVDGGGLSRPAVLGPGGQWPGQQDGVTWEQYQAMQGQRAGDALGGAAGAADLNNPVDRNASARLYGYPPPRFGGSGFGGGYGGKGGGYGRPMGPYGAQPPAQEQPLGRQRFSRYSQPPPAQEQPLDPQRFSRYSQPQMPSYGGKGGGYGGGKGGSGGWFR